jgi:hypothetical protein
MNEQRVVVRRPVDRGDVVTESVRRQPTGVEIARRIVIFVFGVVQLLIGLRIVLLMLDADKSNGLVSGIYGITAVLVAPFEGILRTDAIHANASALDVSALVALVGWTILEVVVLALVGIARREP